MFNKLRSGSEFMNNVLTLISGTVAAQLITFLIAPVLTRLYTAQDFGILAIFASLAGLVGTIATGRYEVAIILPKEDKDAKSLLALSLLFALGVTGVTGVIVLLGDTQIANLYDVPQLADLLYLIPFSVLLLGIVQSLSYFATRAKNFPSISAGKIGDSLGGALVKVGLGIMKIGAGGLVIGNLVGMFTTSLILLVKLSKSGRITNLFQDKENILIQAKRYSDFLKINTIHAFSDVLQAMLLVFFLTSYFGIAAVGFFAFTSRIIKTPVSMVAGSVTQVFFQDTSEKYANGLPIQSMVVKMVRNLALWSAPAFAVLMLFGPWLFALVFGEDWRQAGKYAQIMAPWMYINFVVVPISQIPVVVHQQLSNFLISLFGHILVIGAVIYGGYTGESIESTLTFISASQTIFLIVVIFWIIKISGKVKE